MSSSRKTTPARPKRLLTRAELMQPIPMDCLRCGSRGAILPPTDEHPQGLAVCPHCTPLPRDQWPTWERGQLVKPCGCGSATCPVPAYAEARQA